MTDDLVIDILANLAIAASEIDTIHGFLNRQELDSVRQSLGNVQTRLNKISDLMMELETPTESINDEPNMHSTDVDRPGEDNGDSNGDTPIRQTV